VRLRRRSRLGSDSGEWRHNAGEQAVVGASLGPRGGAWSLGWRWDRAEMCAHRGGSNGGRRSRVCARGGATVPFIDAGSTEGACDIASKEGGNHGATRNGRGTQGSPAGGATRGGGGGLAGSTGERGFRAHPEGDPLGGHEDTIMGLGRVADRSGGPDAEGRAAVCRAPRGATQWRVRSGRCQIQLPQFESSKLLKF
jgi:hypothetical protein